MGGEGERDRVGVDVTNNDRKTCLSSQFGITKGSSSDSQTKLVYNWVNIWMDAQNKAELNIKWHIPLNI